MANFAVPVPVGPVVYAIQVNGKLIRDFPLDVEIRQSFGLHEMAFVRIEYSRTYPAFSSLPLWPENALVQIVWGRGPANLTTFYGYVNHHEFASDADSGTKAPQITYVLIGTSKPMNSETTRTWGQVSPTYIAKQIATEHGLRAVLTSTNWVLDYEVQSAESDFAFLNRIAQKTGYQQWVSGGTLYFIDPAVVLTGSAHQGVAAYRLDKLFTQVDTVRNFKLLQGDNIPGAVKAQRVIYGVDQNTGLPFSVTASSTQGAPITKIQTERVALSYGEAQNLAQAWQNHNQFWVQATAELFGSSLLYPGKLVYLNGQAMPGESAGYWIVTAATHLLKKSGLAYTVGDRYVTRVCLARNQAPAIGPAVKQIAPVRPEFVRCIATSTGWVSASLAVIYDGRTA